MASIGIVEDDEIQSALLGGILESAGHRTVTFSTALDFRRRLSHAPLDALILDWMLPDESGVELLRWLRSSAHATLPVIMLTMRDQEQDVLDAFSAGADDYLVKPASMHVLMARMNAVLRRAGALEPKASLQLPPYTVDSVRRVVAIHDELIELTDKEFDLALCLFRRANLMVSREQLLTEVWRLPMHVATRSIDTYISRLRKKLALDGSHGLRLRTIYQTGYRLETVVPVEAPAA